MRRCWAAHRGAGRLKSQVQKAGEDPGRPHDHGQERTFPPAAKPIGFSAVSASLPGHTGLGLYPDTVSGVGSRLFGFYS